MEYSLSAAAKATGKGKSTIHRAIKSGKISARRDEDGAYHIDAAELSRAFPLNGIGTHQRDDTAPGAEPARNDTAVLEVKVAMLEAQLERERETVDDLRKRLDRAEDRIQMLTHQGAEATKRVGLLRRLFG
jgi:predicted RNase H-like nuclease (RuvC/YqgF family)